MKKQNYKLDDYLIAETRPVANIENQVFWGNYRVTILDKGLFRLENGEQRIFRDKATEKVWYRDMPPQNFKVFNNKTICRIETEICELVLKHKRKDCFILLKGKKFEIANKNNFFGTCRTLDNCSGEFQYDVSSKKYNPVILENGVCSKNGIAVFNDEKSLTLTDDGQLIQEKIDGTDEYIFVYPYDYKNAVKALYKITGNVPMLPRFVFGNWWSRYHKYDEREYLSLLNKFEMYEVPFSVVCVDMDWHYSDNVDRQKGITLNHRNTDFYGGNSGWTGYSWNRELFPDYKRFLRKVKDKNYKITLNLHPADGIRWWEDCYSDMAKAMEKNPETQEKISFDMGDNNFINNYFSVVHKPYEDDGIDFWWVDWQQGQSAKGTEADPMWLLNHYHYLENKNTHKYPLILSRYVGIGGHRYPVGFSGDTEITWETLKYLPYFTATASNIGYTWWSHDIGGHFKGYMDRELYVRSIQFGVFSPILRLHCNNLETISKEPWIYKNGSGNIAIEWLKFRHSMIPYLYTRNYETSKNGKVLIQPMYYDYPENKMAYKYKNQYLFGGDFIVAPVTDKMKNGYSVVKTWLPCGHYTDIFTGDEYFIKSNDQVVKMVRTLDYIPVLAKEGTIFVRSDDKGNSVSNPINLLAECYSGNGRFDLFEDNDNIDNKNFFVTSFKMINKNDEKKVIQKLIIQSHGDKSMIPDNRNIKVVFRNVDRGIISVKENGKETNYEEIYGDNLTIKIMFEPYKKYEIIIKYKPFDKLKYIKERAKNVLLQAEGENFIKYDIFTKIQQIKDTEEYLNIVDNSLLSNIIKLRLKEITC